ncbi:MAG: HupE/UreJ family protein [Acidimicrobiia bacterium]
MKTTPPRTLRGLWLPAFLLLTVATPALQAHVGGGATGGFGSGLKHPWSGFDHIVAMVAVGLWGAQLGAPAIWVLPVAFPMVMALGGFLGLVGIPLPGVEIGIALSGLLLGAAVAMEFRPKHLAWAAALVGVFGLFHGHAHGTELPAGENGLFYSLGFVIATGLLHGLGIGIGEVRRLPAGPKWLRALGGIVAAAGGYFLVRAL